MRKASIKLLVAWILIGACSLRLYLFFHPTAPFDPMVHRGLGEALAVEAKRLVGSGGGVILIARDSNVAESPAPDAQFESLTARLRSEGVRVVSTNWIKLDALRIPAVPPGDFFLLLKKGREDDVVVSLLGPPTFGEVQNHKLGDSKAKIVALCTGATARQSDLKQLFQRGLLHAAVVDRVTVQSSSTPPANPAEAFQRLYQVVTPLNVEQWQASLGGLP